LNNSGSAALAGQAFFEILHSQACGTKVMYPTYLPASGWCYPFPKDEKTNCSKALLNNFEKISVRYKLVL